MSDATDFRVEPEKSEMVRRADRLRLAVRTAGGNKAVSERSGVPNSTLSDYLAGGEWKFGAAWALAQACDVSLDWLAAGEPYKGGAAPTGSLTITPVAPTEGDPFTLRLRTVEKSDIGTSFVSIPRFDVRAAAGPGDEVVEEQRNGSVALEESFFKQNIGVRREDVVTILAEGDSMDPTIRDGDLLFVDVSVKDIQNSRIYVLEVNNRLLVKRVQLRLDGSYVIKSDNPRYEPETVIPSLRDPLRIIGKVIYQAGPVRS